MEEVKLRGWASGAFTGGLLVGLDLLKKKQNAIKSFVIVLLVKLLMMVQFVSKCSKACKTRLVGRSKCIQFMILVCGECFKLGGKPVKCKVGGIFDL